jgi:hypothetical protein
MPVTKKREIKIHIHTFPNCRRRLIRAPRPNGFFTLAWNAIVGYSDDKMATHFS